MDTLQTFNFESNEVRTLLINNEPLFVGNDVAKVLGYTDTKQALRLHVDDEDKRVMSYEEFKGCKNNTFENIPNRGLTVVNESGLYSLIIGSKLPSAKKFKRWVTSEVLPTLRKTGQYSMQPKLPMTYKEALLQLVEQVEARERLEAENAEMKPKASYYDKALNCKDLVSVTTIAKDYGWTAQQLNKYLHEKGVQYKQGKRWFLYKKYADEKNGYTGSKTPLAKGKDGKDHAHIHTYWTQKGRLFIYDLLKNDGILPTIEAKEKGEQ